MKTTEHSVSRLSITILVIALGLPIWSQAQTLPATIAAGGLPIAGVVDDWSHRRLVFSDPGTEEDAIRDGRHEKWLKTVNDPRYVLQQLKRQPPAQPPNIPLEPKKKRPSVHRDWAVSLGGGSVAQSMFPAKYTFSTTSALTSASCTNDFVVYGLNVAGTTGGQANLVALNELYTGSGDGYCGSYSAAQPYWAYNATTKGGKVTTSPVLSLDGTKVMYVESGSNGSYLHILAWYSGDGGTPTSSKAPTNSESYVSACPASASCLVTVTLSTSSTHTITYSSPFYDYTDDVLYVGDDDGTLYKVTPVLAGTAAPTVTSLVVSSGAKLTSPVYDFATGNVFVAGSYNLYAVKASTMALQTHSSLQVGDSSCTSSNNIIYDGPLVDSSNDWVYEWATTGADGTHTIVVQAYTTGTNSPSGSSWTAAETAEVGEGDSGCNSGSNFPTWSPTFDNAYYTGTITSGHMWVCGREASSSSPELWEIPTNGTNGALGTPAALGTSYISATTHAECSPMTEFYNTTTSTDYLFLGEGLAGSLGELYGFTLGSGTATKISSSPVAYPNATGGTSGIVIDNVSNDAQASSIYFTTLGKSTSACGTTSAYCAVKLTQAALE
jgi:hypothetical protein